MDHILLLDPSGKIIASKLPPECRQKCFEEASESMEKCTSSSCAGTRRRAKQKIAKGTIFLCTDDSDLVVSKRRFQERLRLMADTLAAFQEIRDETVKRLHTENRRLVHNLTALNTHILQEIYDITPQDLLIGDPHGQIAAIRTALAKDPDRAAAGALRILKNAVAARNEMQIVRRLQPTESTAPLTPRSHAVHRVVKNALITFFQDSQEKGINWLLGPCTKKVMFDYETVSAALYRLFENAVKYCKKGTEIRISFPIESNKLRIEMEMTSLWIASQEGERIFDEGYSGEVAVNSRLSGDGLGLYFVREMLTLNKARVWWEPIHPENQRTGQFGKNRFTLEFSAEE